MKKHGKEIINALSAVTQLGIYVVVSFGIWILAANYIQKRFGLGNYVSVIGVILGAGSGMLSFVKFCKRYVGSISEGGEDDEK